MRRLNSTRLTTRESTAGGQPARAGRHTTVYLSKYQQKQQQQQQHTHSSSNTTDSQRQRAGNRSEGSFVCFSTWKTQQQHLRIQNQPQINKKVCVVHIVPQHTHSDIITTAHWPQLLAKDELNSSQPSRLLGPHAAGKVDRTKACKEARK